MTANRRAIILTLGTMAAAAVTGLVGPKELDWLPERFERPVLALELARTPDAFNRIAGEFDLRPPFTLARVSLRRNTFADFVFIAFYAATWIVVLRGRPGHVCTVGVILIVAAACADVVEDALILRGLATAGATAPLVTAAALGKWAALTGAFGALAYRFWPDKEVRDGWQIWSAAIAALYAYAAVLCTVGLAVSNPVIERAGLPLTVALFMQLILFWHARGSSSAGPPIAGPR